MQTLLDGRDAGLSLRRVRSTVHKHADAPLLRRLLRADRNRPSGGRASAMVAAIGSGAVFSNGRDFGAWLGLVPRQLSTGDRTILGKVSKQGNRYLRVLFVQAAWVVLIKPQIWERYGLKQWITAAKRRLHPNVLAIALANKLARIAWAVLSNDCDFKCEKTDETPRCA